MTAPKLPELPVGEYGIRTGMDFRRYFTADQMHDYARAAVEASQPKAEAVEGWPEPWEKSSMEYLAKALRNRGDDLSTDAASWLERFATQPESGGQVEARCAECDARLEAVRPGKHQHPTCSQHPAASVAVTEAMVDVAAKALFKECTGCTLISDTDPKHPGYFTAQYRRLAYVTLTAALSQGGKP